MPIQFRSLTGGAFGQGSNVLKETVNRLPGLVDAVGTTVGIRPYKKMLVQVVILRDEQGQPLATPEQVEPSFVEAKRIFSEQAHVRLDLMEPAVLVVPAPSPVDALNVHCDDGAWQEDFARAGRYFRQYCARTSAGRWVGYGAPVTVFIVHDISNKGGCSLGPLTDYVTLEAKMLDRARYRLLAHEVAHACGLWHSEDTNNLMYPKGPGVALTRIQEAVLRNSRHVTYL